MNKMPSGDMSNCEIIFKVDGEFEWLKIEGVEKVTLEPELIEPYSDEDLVLHKSESFSFSFEWGNLDFNRMTRNAIYGTNNWRKFHGLPMIRKCVRP